MVDTREELGITSMFCMAGEFGMDMETLEKDPISGIMLLFVSNIFQGFLLFSFVGLFVLSIVVGRAKATPPTPQQGETPPAPPQSEPTAPTQSEPTAPPQGEPTAPPQGDTPPDPSQSGPQPPIGDSDE